MADKRWSLDDIPWDRFDPGKLDADPIKLVKAASMVEYNGGDYARYLCNVFAGDADLSGRRRGLGGRGGAARRSLGTLGRDGRSRLRFRGQLPALHRGLRAAARRHRLGAWLAYSRAYAARASSYYRPAHVERGIAMTFKAAALSG